MPHRGKRMLRLVPYPLRNWRWRIPPRWIIRMRMAQQGRFRYLTASGLETDKRLLRELFEPRFGHPPNFERPRTFNEKVQWRKLHDRRPLLSLLADKYRVRSYVRERLGSAYLVPLLQVAGSPSRVFLEGFEDSVAVKPSHSSGVCVLIRRPREVTREALQQRLRPPMRVPHGLLLGEWAYWSISPRVLVERLLLDSNGRTPIDYKFHCFDGEARFVEVHLDRFGHHRCAHFTRDWTPLDVSWGPAPPAENPNPPSLLEEMIQAAEALAAGLDYVRVDLYQIRRRIFFGEMTIYPASGLDPTHPEDWDLELGDHWRLPHSTSVPLGRKAPTNS